MIRLKIKENYFKVLDEYTVKESSREVKFSSITIDFTNKTIADLPLKYQEVKLLELDNDYNVIKTIYTGYVNNFILPKMKNRNEYRELEIDLLSPLAMATVRTVDAVGTYNLQPLVREIIQPLVNDGFVLKELNIGNNQITVNYLMETVESALNKLSNKHNFWWYIDENKNIYINSIDYLMGLKPKLTYDDENPIKGLIDVIPSIDATDYCNVVDFTNVRIYNESYFYREKYTFEGVERVKQSYSFPLFKKDYLNKGDKIEFNQPFDISIETAKKMQELSNGYYVNNVFGIRKQVGNSQYYAIRIYLNSNNELVIPQNVSIADDYTEENEWVLVRDVFFKTLIVGLRYNGTEQLEIASVESLTSLIWGKVKIQDNIEINNNEGIISDTGIIEKQINMNEQWKTHDELLEIANSYIKNNVSKVDKVQLKVDYDINLRIGDTIKIDKDSFLINDTYIITDKISRFVDNVKLWEYTLKNTNILENFVDLFRTIEKQEEEKNYNLITSDYASEGFKESYEVTINEN